MGVACQRAVSQKTVKTMWFPAKGSEIVPVLVHVNWAVPGAMFTSDFGVCPDCTAHMAIKEDVSVLPQFQESFVQRKGTPRKHMWLLSVCVVFLSGF